MAETADGFIDQLRQSPFPSQALKISGTVSSIWVHKLRATVDAILVGRNTVTKDNPALNTRKWAGKSPIRILIDPELKIPLDTQIYNTKGRTMVFNHQISKIDAHIEYIQITDKKDIIEFILIELGKRNIQSLLIEGGAFTLSQFIKTNAYQACYIIKSKKRIHTGVSAPKISSSDFRLIPMDTDYIIEYLQSNNTSPLNIE